ncbi:MAG: Hsp20/alpha crystallin family protein [Dehalococcoidia bacterium]
MTPSPHPRRRGGPIPFPEQMEKVFDRLSRVPRRHIWRQLWMRGEEWSPDIDVFEMDSTTTVRVDLPGLKRDDIDISVEGNTLLIEGRREEERPKEEDYFSERPLGRFSRTIQLPEGASPDAIEAEYHDGVLEVRIPHAAAEPPRAVKVPVR